MWSADGEWIYFTSDETGTDQISKIKADGTVKPIQITRNGGFLSKISPDGKTIYYTKSKHRGGIWRSSVDRGAEEFVQEISDAGFKQKYSEDLNEYANQWTMTNNGIYFLAQNSERNFLIKFYDFVSEQIADAPGDYKMPKNIDLLCGIETNGNDIFFCARGPRISNIMLVKLP